MPNDRTQAQEEACEILLGLVKVLVEIDMRLSNEEEQKRPKLQQPLC
jgi:hypothetical protein